MATGSGFSGFDAARFKTAIKGAMRMGLPESTNERATFRWTTEKVFSTKDNSGKAWTKEATPVNLHTKADVQIDCAVEFATRSSLSTGTHMGDFNTPRAVITVLDDDYPSLFDESNGNKMCDKVLLGGNTYVIDYVAPPVGLFTVTVYQIHVSAIDEA